MNDSESDIDFKSIIERLQATLTDNSKRFTKSFFDNLYIECSNPNRMYEVFQKFVASILTDSLQVDKSEAIDCIFRAIRKSPFLLDSLLSALYYWNLNCVKPNTFTQFHKYLNDILTQRNWSLLRIPSIVKPLDQPEANELANISGHSINQCIYEIVFSHTPAEILANSQFINIPIDSTLDFLSTESLNNFADALIIRFINQPTEIFERLERKGMSTCDKLAISIFRSRDIKDINLYTDEQIYDDNEFRFIIENAGLNHDTKIYFMLKKTLTFNNNNPISLYDPKVFVQIIKNIFNQFRTEKPNDKLFPFFSILVLPNADFFDDTFIQTVINCSIFPSSNPNFPDHIFTSSYKCQKFITIKVLFDIFKKTGTEYYEHFEKSFNDAYQNIIVPSCNNAEEYRIEMVFESIFSSYSPKIENADSKLDRSELEELEKANSFVSHVFLWFISNKAEITPLLMHQCIASYIDHYYEAICELTLCAIMKATKIELFLESRTLAIFFDQIFANLFPNSKSNDETNDIKPNIDPKLALNVLYNITIQHFENSEVFLFWNENMAIIIDAIMTSHPLTAELLQFLHDFLEHANEDFINNILSVFIDNFDKQTDHGDDRAMQLLKQFLNID